MALATGATTSYIGSAGGNREDLADKLWRVEQEETPLLSAVGESTATSTLHEWMNVAIDAVDKTNAQLEGDDVTVSSSTAPTRNSNYLQISRKEVAVSGTQEAVKAAGRGSDLNMHKVLKAIALKRDIEAIAFGEQGQNAGNSTTARKTRAFESFITTNDSRGSTGADAGSATAAPTDGTQRVFTETLLQGVLRTMADNGSLESSGRKKKILALGSFNMEKFAGFAGRSTQRQDVAPNAIQAAADIYISSFGQIEAVFSPHTRSRTALIIDPKMVKIAHLTGRKMFEEDLATTGDSKRMFMGSEYCLEMLHEKAHGVVADLTTA